MLRVGRACKAQSLFSIGAWTWKIKRKETKGFINSQEEEEEQEGEEDITITQKQICLLWIPNKKKSVENLQDGVSKGFTIYREFKFKK